MGYENEYDDDLETGGSNAGPPQLKLPNTGDLLNFAVINTRVNVPMYEFGTNAPVMNRRGQQKTATAVTVLVINGQGATIGGQDDARPVRPGDVGTIWIQSYMKFDPDQDKLGGDHLSWGGATDKLGGLKVGTVGQWKHLGELPSKGSFPRKNRKFYLRAAKPEEADQTQQCRDLRAQLSGGEPFPAAAPAVPADQALI